jgi:hypothetical protein
MQHLQFMTDISQGTFFFLESLLRLINDLFS